MLLSKLLIFILVVIIFSSDKPPSDRLESEKSAYVSLNHSIISNDLVPRVNPSQLNQKIREESVNGSIADHNVTDILAQKEKQNEKLYDSSKTENLKDTQDESQVTMLSNCESPKSNIKRQNSSDSTQSDENPKEKKIRFSNQPKNNISDHTEQSFFALFIGAEIAFKPTPQPPGTQSHSTNSEANLHPYSNVSLNPSESDTLYSGDNQGKVIQSFCTGPSGHSSGNSDLPKEAHTLLKDEEKKPIRLYISDQLPQPIWFSSSPLKTTKGVIKLRFNTIINSSLDFQDSFKKYRLRKIPSVVKDPKSYRVLLFSDNLKDSFVPRSTLSKYISEGKLDPKIISFIESSKYFQKQDKKVEIFNKAQFKLFVFSDICIKGNKRVKPCCFSNLINCFDKWREGGKKTDFKSDWEAFKKIHNSENYKRQGKRIPDLSRLLNHIDLVYCLGIEYSGLFLERVPSKNDNSGNSYDVNVETMFQNTKAIFGNDETFSLKKFQLRFSAINIYKECANYYEVRLRSNTIEIELELGIE